MIYHGSTIPNLKVIEPRESTQKGSFVYGTTNMIYAAIFAIIQRTDKPFPPKLGGFQSGNIYLAERFENQFQSLENIKASIYLLDEKNFLSFDNHSAGDSIELRAVGPQEIKGEIKLDNVLDFLKKNNVTLYSYQDREKVGIPKSDKYIVKGILTTYLWKIEGRQQEDWNRGDEFLSQVKQSFSKYNELLDELVTIIKELPEEVAINFVENIYNRKKDSFNQEVIEQAINYLSELNQEPKKGAIKK